MKDILSHALAGVRMSQLRPEDSETVVSMLHRHSSDSRTKSATVSADILAQAEPNFPSIEFACPQSTPSQAVTNKDGVSAREVDALPPHCPVCGRSLRWVGGNESLLNRHVDECLNQVAVDELLAVDRQTSSANK